MKSTSALPKAKQKRFVWILMSVKLARDQTHGAQHRLIGPSNRLRWIWLKPKMPARSRPYGGAKKADKSSRTTAIVLVCIGLFIAQLVCDSQSLRIPLPARRRRSATAGRGACPMTDAAETVESLKIKVMDVFTSLHIISLRLNALADASEPLKDQSHLMRIIKDNICTPQSRRAREKNEGCWT